MSKLPTSQAIPDTLTKIAAFYKPVLSTDRSLSECIAFIDELKARRANALARKEQMGAEMPALPALYHPGTVEALADDPGSEINEEAMIAAAEMKAQHDAAARVWEAKMAMLDQAIAKIDEGIDVATKDMKLIQEGREQLWRDFAGRAWQLLSEEFETRFIALREEILDPLDWLGRLKDQEGKSLIRATWLRPDVSDVKVTKFEPASHLPESTDQTEDGRVSLGGRERWVTTTLYPQPVFGGDRVRFYREFEERFMAAIKRLATTD